MGNGDTLKQLDALLAQEVVTTEAGLRMVLDVQRQLWKAMERMTKTVGVIETQSIGVWIGKHPRLFVGGLVAYFLLSATMDPRTILLEILKVVKP